jgi:hypothetical protein
VLVRVVHLLETLWVGDLINISVFGSKIPR